MTGRALDSLWKVFGIPKTNQVSSYSSGDSSHVISDTIHLRSGARHTLFTHKYHDWLPMMQVNNLGPPGMGPSGGKSPLRFGRHDYITGVSCVPNEKNLPPIDGFQRSSDSSLPEFATWEDREDNRKLYSNRSHPLAEGQVLKSTGM